MNDRDHNPITITPSAVGDLLQRATDSVRRQASQEQTLSELLAALEDAIPVSRSVVWERHAEERMLVSVAGRANGEEWTPGWQRSTDLCPIPDVINERRFVALSGDGMNDFVQSPVFDWWPQPAHLVVGPIIIGEEV